MQPLARPAAPTFAAPHDPHLWQIAKRRAKFQSHLLVYLLVNGGLWALYFLTFEGHHTFEIPWPMWSSLFWGIGLLNQGLYAYSSLNKSEWVQREYERLAAQQSAR